MDYKINEIDVVSGEIILREMTENEIKQYELDAKAEINRKIEIEAKAQAKIVLLEKLGITEDEAKLLLA